MLFELMWRPAQPCRHNSEGEQSVNQGKHPSRGLIKHDAVHPVLNEAALVSTQPCPHSQPVLQRGERALDTEPTFENNH